MPTVGRPGNDLDHPHALDHQGARQVLGQVADLGDLHPAGGLISKRVITGPGQVCTTSALTPYSRKRVLEQLGHLGELLLGVVGLLGSGGVSSRKEGSFAIGLRQVVKHRRWFCRCSTVHSAGPRARRRPRAPARRSLPGAHRLSWRGARRRRSARPPARRARGAPLLVAPGRRLGGIVRSSRSAREASTCRLGGCPNWGLHEPERWERHSESLTRRTLVTTLPQTWLLLTGIAPGECGEAPEEAAPHRPSLRSVLPADHRLEASWASWTASRRRRRHRRHARGGILIQAGVTSSSSGSTGSGNRLRPAPLKPVLMPGVMSRYQGRFELWGHIGGRNDIASARALDVAGNTGTLGNRLASQRGRLRASGGERLGAWISLGGVISTRGLLAGHARRVGGTWLLGRRRALGHLPGDIGALIRIPLRLAKPSFSRPASASSL